MTIVAGLPRPWWPVLLTLQAAAVVLSAIGQHWLVVLSIIAASIFLLAVMTERVGFALIALVPLSQPLVLGSRLAPVMVYPEYLLIPLIFVLVVWQTVKEGGIRTRKTGLVMPLVLFLIVAALSIVFASIRWGWSNASGGLPTWMVHAFAVMYFFSLLQWLGPRVRVRDLFLGMFGASVVVSLLGILEYFFIEVPAGQMVRIGSTLGVVFSETHRGNPNALATYLVIVSLMALGMLGSVRTSTRLLLGVGIVAHVVALLLTQSRSGLLALVVGGAWLMLRGRRHLVLWLLPAAAVGILVAAQVPRLFDRYLSVLSIITSRDLVEFFLRVDPKTIDWAYLGYFGAGGFGIDALAGANRFAAWALGVRTFLDHPWVGIGLQMNMISTGFSTAENYLLDIAVMTGVGGIISVLWWARRVWKIISFGRRVDLGFSERSFLHGCEAVFFSLLVFAMTGSVLFSLKIMLTLLTLVAIAWHVVHGSLRWNTSSR
jgi:hypothetical protein